MQNYYDQWNKVKKELNYNKGKPRSFNEREIYWICIGRNVGDEIYGKGWDFVRPVLIIRKFNKSLFLGIPLSSRLKRNPYYCKISVLGHKRSALISQVRVFSSLRMRNKLARLDEKDFEKVVKRILALIKNSSPC